MKKKKILFLITKATWGGAQRYVFDLATHLPKDEFEPVVAYGQSGILSQKLRVAGIRTCELSALQRDVLFVNDVRGFFQIWSLLRAEKPDSIHLNSSKAAALGALAARLAGIERIIFTAHGWPFKERREAFTRAFIYFVSWLTGILSHRIIVVSKTDEQLGREMWLLRPKIHHIPIGIEAPTFIPRDEAEREIEKKTDYPLGPGVRIVTIAELTPNKGLRYAIQAMELLQEDHPDWTYTVLGEGEERFRLTDSIWELGLQERVLLPGFLENAAQYLKAFDIFLLPSIKEGMPYVLLEAAAAGLPIVTTDVVPETEQTRRVAAGDSSALAAALAEVVTIGARIGSYTSLPEMLNKTVQLYRPAGRHIL